MVKKKRRGESVPKKLMSVVSINCGVDSKTCTPTSEVTVLSPPFGRNLTVGFKNEKKTTNYGCYYQLKKIIPDIVRSEKKGYKKRQADKLSGKPCHERYKTKREGDPISSDCKSPLSKMMTQANKTLTCKKCAGGFNLQKWLGKTGIKFHCPLIRTWEPAHI